MSHGLNIENIPGTVLPMAKMDGATGLDFLNKVFFITDGIMLAQIREITGVDGTTLQNWLKRGWVPKPNNKCYGREHLARILIINMMRDTMQLSRVDFVLRYINGDIDNCEDDIIEESLLYDYICRVMMTISDENSTGFNAIAEVVDSVLEGYTEKYSGAKRRLSTGLTIIVTSYYASLVKAVADGILDELDDSRRRR